MQIRTKSVLLWAAMLAVVSVGITSVVLISLPSTAVTYVAGELPRAVDASDRARTAGDAKAPVTVVVYSDFQCPACAAFAASLHQLPVDATLNMRVVYRYFPLPNHKNAIIAALAAEAAAEQGRFWQMHDLLYERQMQWAELPDAYAAMVGYARELKLDLGAFEKALQSDATVARVKATHDEAFNARLPGTPAVFVNGRRIDNAHNLEALKGAIHEASKR